jgi:probable F420-dependent oxidoreductase
MFHEPLVLLGYLAAITTRIEFFTSMLVLPQRQAALVAKQAAEVDVLTRGRLRFGAGLGWNAVEFEALGQDFNTRGERCEEQIALLRELWTKPSVTFRGRWHSVTAAGLNPLPVQRPIPIWVGGALEVVLKHVGRMADGWVMPACDPRQEDAKAMPGRFRRHISEQGHKDSRTVGIEARVTLQTDPLEECIQRTHRWRELDATHTGINTMAYGFTAIDQHLETLHRYLAAVQH